MALFEIIRGWYPDISLKEMLVCWQAYWAKTDHRFPAYDEVKARLEKSQAYQIPEALRKEFHVNDGGDGSQLLSLFSSQWDVKRAISQARRKGNIRHKITEHTSYDPGKEKPDPITLMWRPAIFVLLDEALYKKFDEATNQILDCSMKQFFPSSPGEEEDYGEEVIDDDDIDHSNRLQ
jgi:hypothetical protein